MDTKYFKDKIFELLNETDNIGISDIETYDKKMFSRHFSKWENL